MSDSDNDASTRATARLPGLDIEITHRRSTSGEAEQISINLQAVPSFDAFSRFVESANPLAFWAKALQMAWLPWLAATQTALPPGVTLPQLGLEAPTHADTPAATSAAESKTAEDARRTTDARVPKDARRAAEAKKTGSALKIKAAEVARSGVKARPLRRGVGAAEAKVSEAARPMKVSKIANAARRIAKAKAPKKTGSVVTTQVAEEARGRSKGH
jgi:hypothetical protein